MAEQARAVLQQRSVRGTESFVHTLSACWKRPSLTLLEVGWRWAYGIPTLVLVSWRVRLALLAATGGTLDPARLGLDRQLLNDPVGALSADPLSATGKLTGAIGMLLLEVRHVAMWLVPLLLIAWVVVSSLGRSVVLRRADAQMHNRPGTLIMLQAMRIATLTGIFFVWFAGLRWSAGVAIQAPTAAGAEPNLVLYCALVILLTLGLFTLWAFVSWVLAIAPLLAMLRDLGVRESLVGALRLGPLRAKLVEINLITGIVKIALIVLAIVFSATPLPFETITTPEFLGWWWAGVTVLYLVWSDFFHVARLIAYLNLWRTFETS